MTVDKTVDIPEICKKMGPRKPGTLDITDLGDKI